AKDRYQALFEDQYPSFIIEDWIYKYDFAHQKLLQQFGTQTLKGFGIHEMAQAIVAAGAILYYLEETEHKELAHISSITRLEEERYMWLDRFSVRNLELLSPNQPDGIPLIDVLNHVVTPMGSRMLRKWVVLPLKEKKAITARLNRVAALFEDPTRLESIIASLKKMGDLERLVSKVATGRINPRELHQLKNSLEPIGRIKTLLADSPEKCLQQLAKSLNDHEDFMHHVTQSLTDAPPMLLHQGNVIREGVDADLDEYRSLAFSGKDYLLGIQKREAESTGITSLKIAYNKVFGYYLEVSNTHKDKVPTGWIRKQTLVNAERYITEELKVYEEKILQAESQLGVIESRLYQELVVYAKGHMGPIQEDARLIATLDCLSNFAAIAKAHQYVCPSLSEASIIDIKAGRHPVIERLMAPGESYIPNDVYLDNESQQILVITGPNMSGKSALLRQTALIVIMAQIGSFVPAGYAKIGITDKIFTRVGASDNLSRGESTFMVEMTETASILNNLSDQSLVIMDEIGRGTSTYDGISIAWSIVEYLHNDQKAKPKTLFATHYHELNQLAGDLTRVQNFHIAVKELKDQVIFLRKLVSGGTEHSFGIHVAQMAGMPNQVILRSNEILKLLEKEKGGVAESEILANLPTHNFQLNLFEADPRIEQLMSQLRDVDVNNISPVDALVKLNELKKLLKK
ncbi:DNA mismatch repair protein MutS, partial [Cyclobacteriaceae bacterium]|nr:DNA mismatch repair protein MutS [Cyclobacteriaceae bacterium]